MFVEVRAVEHAQAVAIAWEMCRYPIKYHADAVLVAMVDQVHEVLRRAVTARGGIVTDGLISPTEGVGVLADRQQFEVGEAHLETVVDKLVRELAIGEPTVRVISRTAPTAEMHFVERHRAVESVVLLPIGHPGRVVPMVAIEIGHFGRRAGRKLGGETIGIGLL